MSFSKQTRFGSAFLPVFFAVVLASCTSPDQVAGPTPPAPPGPPASIEISVPGGEMSVNETRPLQVTVKDAAGQVLSDVTPTFTSSDSSIATVSPTGVVLARWPGVAWIEVAVASVKARAAVRVISRLRIGLELVADWGPQIDLAVGDTVRLKPYVSDANGHYLEIHPEVTWSSTNPEGISVDSRGMLTALEDGATAEIRAVGPEGVGIMPVRVSIPSSGPPAILRVANALTGVGPITFVPTKGAAKTLNPGEAATMEIPPGIVLVEAQTSPYQFHSYPSVQGVSIKSGEKVTFYVVGVPDQPRLTEVWTTPRDVSPEKAVLNVMQTGFEFSAICIQRPGSGPTDDRLNCYYDSPENVEWEGDAGSLDLLLLGAYQDNEVQTQVQTQVRVEAKGGMRTTVILSGSAQSGTTAFSFPDP